MAVFQITDSEGSYWAVLYADSCPNFNTNGEIMDSSWLSAVPTSDVSAP
jgi:hypothetical protein